MSAAEFPNEPRRPNGDRRAVDRSYGEDDVQILCEGQAPLLGVLLELSADGARIRLEAHAELPERLGVYVPASGLTRSARIVRRQGDEIGLGFLDL